MNILFITIEDRLYLPGLFQGLFSRKKPENQYSVLLVDPVYKNDTKLTMAKKYLDTFGVAEFIAFAIENMAYLLLDKFSIATRGKSRFSVKGLTKAYGMECLVTHEDVNSDGVLNMIRLKNYDLIVSVACPQIFGKKLLGLPKLGCLNLHGSPLPRYRGVLPSFWMLKSGETEAYNSVFIINEVIDGGDLVVQDSFPIRREETLRSLIRRSKKLAAESISSAIEKMSKGGYERRSIDPSSGSYFGWPTAKDVKEFKRMGGGLR